MALTVRIQMGHSRNASLLRDALPSTYQVILAQQALPEEGHAFDLCIIDQGIFGQVHEAIRKWKAEVAPLFLPVLLLIEPKQPLHLPEELWEIVDDVVRMPVSKAELLGRIRLMLGARQSSLELHELYAEFEGSDALTPLSSPSLRQVQETLSAMNARMRNLEEAIKGRLEPDEKQLLRSIYAAGEGLFADDSETPEV